MNRIFYDQNIDDNIIELEKGFKSFYLFALSLIKDLNKENGHLKFAVVNIQISLELFLKYYFLMKGESKKVFKITKGKAEYRQFSDIAADFYKYNKSEQNLPKKRLVKIMEARNNIVHKGKFNEWCEDTAEYIIECAFFIQETLGKEFGVSLLKPNYPSDRVDINPFWRDGAYKYAKKLIHDTNDVVMECPFCFSKSLIHNSHFDFFEESYIDDGLSCLSCFCCVDLEMEGDLIICCACDKKSYFVETNNIQKDKLHLSKCFYCDNTMDVRTCEYCDKHYFVDMTDSEVFHNGSYFCSNSCFNNYLLSKS